MKFAVFSPFLHTRTKIVERGDHCGHGRFVANFPQRLRRLLSAISPHYCPKFVTKQPSKDQSKEEQSIYRIMETIRYKRQLQAGLLSGSASIRRQYQPIRPEVKPQNVVFSDQKRIVNTPESKYL
jgi:hypothetical protein